MTKKVDVIGIAHVGRKKIIAGRALSALAMLLDINRIDLLEI